MIINKEPYLIEYNVRMEIQNANLTEIKYRLGKNLVQQ